MANTTKGKLKEIKIKSVFILFPPDGEDGLPQPDIKGYKCITLKEVMINDNLCYQYDYIPDWIDLCSGGNAKRVRGNKIIVKEPTVKTKVMDTILCSAFPATGKTFFYDTSLKKVLDSDSSKFDKSKFPDNYIQHIKNNIGKVDIILISSHKEVRDALVNEGMEFTLVYPNFELKYEYLNRLKERGSDKAFIKLISDNWYKWIFELYGQEGCRHIRLKSEQYITDVNFRSYKELIVHFFKKIFRKK